VVIDDAAIVFVVVSDHEAARRLSDDVEPWLSQDLARPFMVVSVSDVLGVQDPLGHWVGYSGEVVSCFSAVAERSYGAIRVVAYQEVSRGSSGDPNTVEAARLLGDSFQFRKAPSQQLTILNVLVPDDRVRDLPPDLLSLNVSANVVVAPEDRESPTHASHPLDDVARLRVHGLMSLFVCAALWRHQHNGPLDGQQTGSFNEVPHVVLLRAYGRVARAPMLVERIARSVFAQRRTAQWAAEAVNGVQARDPEHIALRQSERFLERHKSAFDFDPPPSASKPKLQTVGVLEAFAMMFGYIFRGLRTLPSEVRGQVSEAARRVAGEVAQSVTFGAGSRMRVHGSLALTGPAPDPVSATSDLASMLLERAGGGDATPPAAGDAWQELRALAFALHDGSDLPEGFDRPSDGVITEVITDVGAITPDPALGPFVIAPGTAGGLSARAMTPIRVNDVMSADDLILELEELQAEEEMNRLADWMEQRKASLLWRVAAHLASQFRAAESLLGTSLERVGKGAASLDGALAQQARRRLLRSWWVWLGLTVLAAGANYAYLQTEGRAPEGPALGIYLGVSVAIWLIGWSYFFLRYQRRMFKIEHRRDRENAEYHAAVTDTFHAAAGLVRLGSMYQQLQDWGEITGWMLHHPEGELDATEDIAVEVDLAAPASHRIGLAQWDDGSMRRLAAIVGRSLFGRSWLSNLFVEYRDASMAQLRYELGHDESAPEPDPDWDVRTPGPRPYLLAQLQKRQLAKLWTDRSVDVVQELLNDVNPNELLDSIEDEFGSTPASDFLYGILSDRRGYAEPADMAIPLWTNEARMHMRQQVADTVLWSSNPLPADIAGASEGRVARTRLRERSILDVLVVRADLCAPVPFTDLKLFAVATMVPGPSAEPAPSATPW
jgi:hypothetical protein